MRAGEPSGKEGERAAPQAILTRSVQEGSCRTGHTAEAASVSAPLQPLLPRLTGLGAHRGRSLSGARRGSGRRAVQAAGHLAECQPRPAAFRQLAASFQDRPWAGAKSSPHCSSYGGGGKMRLFKGKVGVFLVRVPWGFFGRMKADSPPHTTSACPAMGKYARTGSVGDAAGSAVSNK